VQSAPDASGREPRGGRGSRRLARVIGAVVACTLVLAPAAHAFPSGHVVSPERWKAYVVGDVVVADYSCTDVYPTPQGCEGPVPSGSPVDTSTPGRHEFAVWAHSDVASTSSPVNYWVVGITTPTVDAEIDRGSRVPADFDCEALNSLCSATVVLPGGEIVPIADGDPLPATTMGVHELRIRMSNLSGERSSTVTRTYRVVDVADPTPDPDPAPVDPPVTTPTDPPVVDAPAPPTQVAPVTVPRTCPIRAIELLAIRPGGTRSRPTARLHGWADRSLAGDVVRIRRDGRTVGRATVRRDGSVAVTVAAPRDGRARSRARYRLTVGGLRSRALKATRHLVYTTVARRGDGSVVVTGRSTLRRAPRGYELVAGSTCGVGPSATTRVRADRKGRFRVVLRPPASGEGLIYRLRAAGRSATLPVVVLAR